MSLQEPWESEKEVERGLSLNCDIRKGDMILLCSDGLSNMVEDKEIRADCDRAEEMWQKAAQRS